MCKKNGETFDVQLSATAEFDGDRNLIRSMAFLIDVSERNRASQALENRLKIETLISELSKQFINLEANQIDDGIQWALQKIGEFAGVDRCYLFQLDHTKEIAVNTLEWCHTIVEPQIDHLQKVGFSEISFVIGKIKGQETIHIPDIKALPDSLRAEREHWLAQDICSLLTVPVGFDGQVAGFIGFDSSQQPKILAGGRCPLVESRRRNDWRPPASPGLNRSLTKQSGPFEPSGKAVVGNYLSYQSRRCDDLHQ